MSTLHKCRSAFRCFYYQVWMFKHCNHRVGYLIYQYWPLKLLVDLRTKCKWKQSKKREGGGVPNLDKREHSNFAKSNLHVYAQCEDVMAEFMALWVLSVGRYGCTWGWSGFMAWSPMWVLLLYALLALQAQVTGRSIKKKKKKKREKRPRCDFVNQRKNESNERRGKWKSFLGAQYKIRDIW